MRNTKTSGTLSLLTLIVGLGLMIFGASEVWAATQNCAATGTNGTPKSVNCGVATCPPPAGVTCAANNPGNIPAGTGTLPATHPTYPNRPYRWCTCPGETETDCCHLVAVVNAGGTAIIGWATVGQCVPCPLPGVCKITTVGTQVTAYCD